VGKKEDLIKNMSIAYEENADLISKKYSNFIIAKIFLYLGVVLLLFHLGLLFLGIDRVIIPLK
jgi:hypothetical protein